jgi:molecular chaperone GrpE
MSAASKRSKSKQASKRDGASTAADRADFKVTDKRAATSMPEPESETSGDGANDAYEDLEKRHQNVMDRLTRAHADFANFRRRAELETQELAKFANQALALDVLRVVDGLDRAFRSLPSSLRHITWIDGIALVQAQLHGVLEAHSVTQIECKVGESVDISVQEVVVTDESEGPLVVLEELQRGYRMHDRVLRPTQVRLGPRPDAASGSATDDGEQGVDESPAVRPAGSTRDDV